MRHAAFAVLAITLALLPACSTPAPAPRFDTGAPVDAHVTDASLQDVGADAARDGAISDAGPLDTGAVDAAGVDAAVDPDAAPSGDAGTDAAAAAAAGADGGADAGRDGGTDAAIVADAGRDAGGDAGCASAAACSDGNPCTTDTCTAGACANTPISVDDSNVCTTDACNTSSGAITLVAIAGCCLAASACPGVDTECRMRTCVSNACGFSFTAAGTATSSQVAGDCRRNECDGAGAVVTVNYDADVPDDGQQCTTDLCASGVPSHGFVTMGTSCTMAGSVCDGAGACVGCLVASTCPGTDTACRMRTCSAGACGFSYPPNHTIVASTAGDCSANECDGAGGINPIPDNADVPVDGRECTRDLCTAGVPSNPPLGAGTACSQSGGTQCDGSGSCVSPPSVVSTTPSDATSAIATTRISVTFSTAMLASSLTAQTGAGACTGSIQVSLDGFASCIAFAAATPVMSGGGTVATLTAQPGLLVNRTYRIRVTTAALSAASLPLPATYTHATGFTTGSPDTCAGSVVIAQVYGAGGNGGAAYRNDYVVLHNRGASSVTMTNWSIQYAATMGTSWNATTINGTIPAGGYFLVQEASGGAVGAPLPTADATGSINFAIGAGKVALLSVATTIASGTVCPTANVVDLVGFGVGTNCYEGSGPTAPPTAANAVLRAATSCGDVDDNAGDFASAAAAPLSSASPVALCACVVHNESGTALEADYCDVQFPLSLSVAAGAASPLVYGQLYEAGTTEPAGAAATVRAQLGYGPPTANPEYEAGWSWSNGSFNVQVGNNDEYQASLTAPASGSYLYAYRFSLDRGVTWTVCDANTGDAGAGSNPGLTLEYATLPVLTVP